MWLFCILVSIALVLRHSKDHVGIVETLQISTVEELPSSQLSKALYVIVDVGELMTILLTHWCSSAKLDFQNKDLEEMI